MKVGDLVRWNKHWSEAPGEWDIGLVFSICKDPKWVEVQVEVLWVSGFWIQSINHIEIISEAR